ncbi:MAG: hypothetical protein JKX80_00485 [Candidatus Pacebacteria bacterium]|nr:hypothetical protein [Candidatus Paceibacterota bacterium]
MKKNIKLRDVRAVAEATAAVAILVAVLTITGELWHPLKDTLKTIFTHHWLGKGALSIAVFALVYWLRKDVPARNGATVHALYLAVIASFAATAAMLIFFVIHFLHLV